MKSRNLCEWAAAHAKSVFSVDKSGKFGFHGQIVLGRAPDWYQVGSTLPDGFALDHSRSGVDSPVYWQSEAYRAIVVYTGPFVIGFLYGNATSIDLDQAIALASDPGLLTLALKRTMVVDPSGVSTAPVKRMIQSETPLLSEDEAEQLAEVLLHRHRLLTFDTILEIVTGVCPRLPLRDGYSLARHLLGIVNSLSKALSADVSAG